MTDFIRYNCGEYAPGLEPIVIGNTNSTVPVIVVPNNPGNIDPPYLPYIPPLIPPLSGPWYQGQNSVQPVTGIPPGNGQSGGQSAETRYRCNETQLYCPQDIKLNLPLEQRRTYIRKDCVVCSQVRDPETNQFYWPAGCVFTTREQCINSPCVTNNTCVEIVQGRNEVQVNTVNVNTSYSNSISQVDPVRNVITIDLTQQTINPAQTTINGGSEPLLDKRYNIFQYPENSNTVMVGNSRNQDIFSNMVAQEVEYFLNRVDARTPWDERYVFGLTNEKVAISLAPELLNAINNIKNPAGERISPSIFLNAIKKHLMEGTIDQVDPGFYINLSNLQLNDPEIVIKKSDIKDYLIRNAIGISVGQRISADPDQNEGYTKNLVKRQRRLNTDINAQILVDPLDQEEQYMALEDAGIPVVAESGTHCEIGDGAGYYIHCDLLSGTDEPCPLRTDINIAYFVPFNAKLLALKIMNESYSFNLSVTSTSSSELTSSAIPAYSLEPKYYAVDLTSIEDLPTTNPFVNRTKCRYTLLTDESEIQRHTLNNGIAVTQVNVNFDDPFIRYALESSSIELSQNDLTFRNFDENRSIIGNTLLSRQIPFALVVCPGAGSKHNPFNGNSKISTFSGNVVSRVLEVVPTVDYVTTNPVNSPLQEANIVNEINESRVGIAESLDVQGRSFIFNSSTLGNTFYTTEGYTSANRTPENYGYSYLLNNIIDPLIQQNSPSSLTWWDVYRRLPINRFCELLYDSNQYLHNSICKGYREGVPIKNVLARNTQDTIQFIEDENIILSSEDRSWLV